MSSYYTIRWAGDHVSMIDQRRLPTEELYLRHDTWQEVAHSIETMVIRGAPAIGIAAAMGIALAAVLFMKRMAELTGVELVTEGESEESRPLGKSYVAYQIKGPLYFGAAKTALGTLSNISHQVRRIILDFSHVEMIDATGLTSLRSLLTELQNKGIRVDISGVHGRMMPIFERAEIYPAKGEFCFYSSMQEALTHAARDEAHARLSAMESWA